MEELTTELITETITEEPTEIEPITETTTEEPTETESTTEIVTELVSETYTTSVNDTINVEQLNAFTWYGTAFIIAFFFFWVCKGVYRLFNMFF